MWPVAGRVRTLAALYMLPIVYESHWRACHPLHFDAKLPEIQVRHGISAQEVLTQLKQLYRTEAVNADPELLREFVPSRPVPGEATLEGNLRIQQAIDDKVLTAVKLLFGAVLGRTGSPPSKAPRGPKRLCPMPHLETRCRAHCELGVTSVLEIEPPLMTPVWQKSALFNHKTHRADLAECHAGASASKENGDQPLLPGINTCVACHAPAASRQAGQPGGARTACTECHRYHNGDHPEQGPGARWRRGDVEQSLDSFLRGRKTLADRPRDPARLAATEPAGESHDR